MIAAFDLSQEVGKKAACEAMTVPRATFYRHMSQSPLKKKSPVRPRSGSHKAGEKDRQ